MRIALANVILLAGWIAIAWVDRPISRLWVGSAAVTAAGAAVMLPAAPPAAPLADSRSQRADPLQRPGNSRTSARSRRTTTRSSWRNV